MIKNNLMDIRLTVKLRAGIKVMTLEELENLKDGNIVELDQLANDPIQILVDDIIIAHGEVVIVDGMFGIQVTKVLDESILGHSNETRL